VDLIQSLISNLGNNLSNKLLESSLPVVVRKNMIMILSNYLSEFERIRTNDGKR
jgi:hypothetical protein